MCEKKLNCRILIVSFQVSGDKILAQEQFIYLFIYFLHSFGLLWLYRQYSWRYDRKQGERGSDTQQRDPGREKNLGPLQSLSWAKRCSSSGTVLTMIMEKSLTSCRNNIVQWNIKFGSELQHLCSNNTEHGRPPEVFSHQADFHPKDLHGQYINKYKQIQLHTALLPCTLLLYCNFISCCVNTWMLLEFRHTLCNNNKRILILILEMLLN